MVQYHRKPDEYKRVVTLRHRGFSVRAISKKVPVSKSTISLWCKDVALSADQKRVLREKWQNAIGQRLGAKANHEKRERQIAEIRKAAMREIRSVSPYGFKIAGSMLYWAEGSKTGSASISNSDPRIIKFMVRWLSEVCDIPASRLRAHLHIHHGDHDLSIKRYWSRLTGMPLTNFGKSFIKPKGTGHRKNVLPNGIIKVRVKGMGCGDLRHKILAWAEKTYELSMRR